MRSPILSNPTTLGVVTALLALLGLLMQPGVLNTTHRPAPAVAPSRGDVLAFAAKAASVYGHVPGAPLQAASSYFTDTGWSNYQKAVNDSTPSSLNQRLDFSVSTSGLSAPRLQSHQVDPKGQETWTVMEPVQTVYHLPGQMSPIVKRANVYMSLVTHPSTSAADRVRMNAYIMAPVPDAS